MLDPAEFLADLDALGLSNFYGVPDSLLAPLMSALERVEVDFEITANEGAAVGLAIGRYFATGRPAAVFLQNSGLGNVVNPLASLAHPDIYGVPMLLVVGWRGEMDGDTQLKDEPQHVFQGRVTPAMLDLMEIPYTEVAPTRDRAAARDAVARMLQDCPDRPCALLVRKGAFAKVDAPNRAAEGMPREQAIAAAVAALGDLPLVATTGKIGRELYELGVPNSSFLSVGGMGHASMIAAGLARDGKRRVAMLDGDGAVLMHAGSLATTARCPGLIHIVLNNRCHDSVGGAPTAGPNLDLSAVARAFGYASARRVTDLEALRQTVAEALTHSAASFIEMMVAPGARSDLGRPKEHPGQAKQTFMEALR